MDSSGQMYFAPEDLLPQEDLDRMRDAEKLELARRAQVEKDRRLLEELQRALGSAE